ncbi:hypothetical protein [Alcaligenes phenolicus]|uniref:Uncharacterized protein n=1 Tax=Alcaligenes phenolicus TaxID=232846 RepID=A0ABV2BDI2_9BURK
MNYKKFSELPGVELRLLSAIGVLTQQRRAFKIDNSPNYGISHYDRHNMETYFFADSHSFPSNVSFVIHVDKESEAIISDDELKDYQAEWKIDNNVEDGDEILSRILVAGGEIGLSVDRVDDFELYGIYRTTTRRQHGEDDQVYWRIQSELLRYSAGRVEPLCVL